MDEYITAAEMVERWPDGNIPDSVKLKMAGGFMVHRWEEAKPFQRYQKRDLEYYDLHGSKGTGYASDVRTVNEKYRFAIREVE